MLEMSHVFPLSVTAPALRRLTLVTLTLAGILAAAHACAPESATAQVSACGTPTEVVEDLKAAGVYSAHTVLTPNEAFRGIESVATGGPAEADIREALLVLRPDGALAILAWTTDGKCGVVIVSPAAAQRLLTAIKGVAS